MTRVVYDAGALVAADRGNRRFWADHKVRLELGLVPVVPAPVVAQVSRSSRQVALRRLLAGCDVLAMTESDAHAIGAILAAAGSADVVDGAVVLTAASGGQVHTSDVRDIERLVDTVGLSGIDVLRLP